eukprot:5818204-Prymnesium_polylepis.1
MHAPGMYPRGRGRTRGHEPIGDGVSTVSMYVQATRGAGGLGQGAVNIVSDASGGRACSGCRAMWSR